MMQMSQLLDDGILFEKKVELMIDKFNETGIQNVFECTLKYCKLFYNNEEKTLYMFSEYTSDTIRSELKNAIAFIQKNSVMKV